MLLFYKNLFFKARAQALDFGKRNKHSIPLVMIKIMGKKGLKGIKEMLKKGAKAR